MSGHASTTFADRLREAQGEKSTEALAREINVTVRVVQKWRSGEIKPSGSSLARLCLATGKPVEFFFPSEEIVA